MTKTRIAEIRARNDNIDACHALFFAAIAADVQLHAALVAAYGHVRAAQQRNADDHPDHPEVVTAIVAAQRATDAWLAACAADQGRECINMEPPHEWSRVP